MADVVLDISGVHAWYGESHILHGVDLKVHKGEVVTLLGRNGAGRTSTLKAVLGMVGRRSGSIKVNGVETYYLNITSDRYAIRLAQRENAETQGDVNISDLEFILADLAMKSNVDDSIRLGRHVQGSLVGRLRQDHKDVADLGLFFGEDHLGTRVVVKIVAAERYVHRFLFAELFRHALFDQPCAEVADLVGIDLVCDAGDGLITAGLLQDLDRAADGPEDRAVLGNRDRFLIEQLNGGHVVDRICRHLTRRRIE